ncbi:MAG: aldo/keto reductase [Acholeplasmataceae bacterium]
MKTIQLHNGIHIPMIGLGTWKSKEDEAYQAVLHALKVGYRHIDTAFIYGNEKVVGQAIKDSGIPREDIFITTKLWNSDQGYESALKAAELSLTQLGLDYVDLYLIHWFKGHDKDLASWRALEKLYKDGKAKAIGVSNHNVHHIEYLLEHAEIKPMINQVETHVELPNKYLQAYCESNGILLQAYAPLMSSDIQTLLSKEVLQDIAKKYNKTVPQIAIRWLLQRGIIVLPKSINPSRIEQNNDVFDFELSEEDMTSIISLETGRKRFPEMDNVPF